MSYTFTEGGAPRNFYFEAALGNVPGISQDFIVGVTQPRDTSHGNLTIWDNDFELTRLTTPTEVFVNSTSGSDVGNIVNVIGLDSNYDRVVTPVTLNGQTPVSAGIYGHVQSAALSVGSAAFAGDIYIATTGTLTAGVPDDNTTVKTKIVQGNNTSRNVFYMVPNGYLLALTAIRTSVDSANKTATIHTQITPDGGLAPLETVVYSVQAGLNEFLFNTTPLATAYNFQGGFTAILGPKTFVNYTCQVDSNNTVVFFGSDILLIDKNIFGKSAQ